MMYDPFHAQQIIIDAIISASFLLVGLFIYHFISKELKTIKYPNLGVRSYGADQFVFLFLVLYIVRNIVTGQGLIGLHKSAVIVTVMLRIYLCTFLVFYIRIRKKVKPYGFFTLGDIIGHFYGKYAKIITGILVLSFSLASGGVSNVCLQCLYLLLPPNISFDASTLLASSILMSYLILDTARPLTANDVIRFFVLIVMFMVVVPLLIYGVPEAKDTLQKIFCEKPSLFRYQEIDSDNYSIGLFLLIASLLFFLDNSIYGEPFLDDNDPKIKPGYSKISSFLYNLFWLLVLVLWVIYSYLLIISVAQVKPAIPTLFSQLRPLRYSSIVILIILFFLGVFIYNTDPLVSLYLPPIITEDIIKPFSNSIQRSINEKKTVSYCKRILSIISIVAAFHPSTMVRARMYSIVAIVPIVFIPLIAAIMRLKTDAKTFIISCLINISSFLFIELVLNLNNSDLIIPMMLTILGINLITFFVVHFIRYKGFVKTERAYPFHISMLNNEDTSNEEASKTFLN